jgi:arsenate reductase-like glutaredoxin family protein
MVQLSRTCVRVKSAIEERSCDAVEISADEGSRIEIAPICDMLENGVEDVCRDEVSSWVKHNKTDKHPTGE